MNQSTEVTIQMIYEECCNCGVVFGITDVLRRKRLEDKNSFYCPNGHAQHFTGKSANDRIKRLESDLQFQKNRVGMRDADLLVEKSRHRTTIGKLGAVTKKVKRVENGVCPNCNRSFANVSRHMKSQHVTN